MKAASSDRVPTTPGWAAEFKWDGMRIQTATDGNLVTLRSASGRDVTSSFPELAGLGKALGAPAILDGEVVSFVGDRPSFRHLQHRIHQSNPTPELRASHPIVYLVFDLLDLDGNPLLTLPYETRRRLLADLLPEDPRWHTPAFLLDGGAEMLAVATERDLEGVMMKKLTSTYQPGARSKDWLKIKVRHHQEFVVGGWLAGQGSLSDQIGSLMVGVWDGEDLVMAGRVGSGLSDAERARLAATFVSRSDPPFRSIPRLDRRAGWVEPTTVVEVEFSEWPADGTLRHPRYLGLRLDTDARAVTREGPCLR